MLLGWGILLKQLVTSPENRHSMRRSPYRILMALSGGKEFRRLSWDITDVVATSGTSRKVRWCSADVQFKVTVQLLEVVFNSLLLHPCTYHGIAASDRQLHQHIAGAYIHEHAPLCSHDDAHHPRTPHVVRVSTPTRHITRNQTPIQATICIDKLIQPSFRSQACRGTAAAESAPED